MAPRGVKRGHNEMAQPVEPHIEHDKAAKKEEEDDEVEQSPSGWAGVVAEQGQDEDSEQSSEDEAPARASKKLRVSLSCWKCSKNSQDW
jgi:hypothetical protein